MQTTEIKIEAFGEIERLLPKPLQFEFAKESLILYINAYRLAEKYANIATNCYDTAEILKEINEVDLQLK